MKNKKADFNLKLKNKMKTCCNYLREKNPLNTSLKEETNKNKNLN